jgi:iron-sulfur cluster repair protein YtfE (RIC family)
MEKDSAMIDLGWSIPTHRVDAAAARRGILWQHERIRALLEHARAAAEVRLEDESRSPEAVRSAICDLCSTMELHLRFEETVLLPLLNEDLPAGPQRAHELIDEHTRQRTMLAALHQEASEHPELPMLATKLAFLASWLLADMAEEERGLLNADVARDDVRVVEHASK